MNCGKIIIHFILAILAIQVVTSATRSIVIDRTDLKNLLQQSAKYKDCTRIVLSKGPIPMRFRRGVKDEFPCIIEMN